MKSTFGFFQLKCRKLIKTTSSSWNIKTTWCSVYCTPTRTIREGIVDPFGRNMFLVFRASEVSHLPLISTETAKIFLSSVEFPTEFSVRFWSPARFSADFHGISPFFNTWAEVVEKHSKRLGRTTSVSVAWIRSDKVPLAQLVKHVETPHVFRRFVRGLGCDGVGEAIRRSSLSICFNGFSLSWRNWSKGDLIVLHFLQLNVWGLKIWTAFPSWLWTRESI